MKLQAESFHLNGHIIEFSPQTQKLETPYKTPSNTLAVKGLKGHFWIKPIIVITALTCVTWNFTERKMSIGVLTSATTEVFVGVVYNNIFFDMRISDSLRTYSVEGSRVILWF